MDGSDPGVSRCARTRPIVFSVALAAALSMLALLAHPALAGVPLNGGSAPLTGSTFQGADGNQRTPLPGDPDYVALPARTDWQTYATSPRLSTLPDGSGLQDRWFFQGKEQEPDSWTFQQDTVSPGKADVLGAWSLTDPVSSNVFLYLSFFRAAAGGTTFYDFELNQLTSTWTNSKGTVVPCRQDGDIIVSFELQGGAGDVGVQAWRWQSTSPGPAACPEGKVGTWTPSGLLSTDAMGNTIAQGAMNTGPIANYLDFDPDGDGDPSTNPSPTEFTTADTFGEAALNLSKVLAGLNGGDSCFNFGQLQMHTRSSAPFTSDLKDFIAPEPIIARSCAIEGTKFHDVDADGTQDAGEPGLSGFRIYADTNGNGGFDAGEPSTFTADGTQPGKPLGSWVLSNLPAGGYKIREDLTNPSGNPRATEGWTCSAPAAGCKFDVALANGGVVGGLEIGNYKKARLRVRKETLPDGAAGSFGFTSTIPGTASFSLADGGVEEMLVAPGVYTAAETPHPDFVLTNIACTSGGQATSPTGVRFSAKSGDTITCTFTNTRLGTVEIEKQTDPATDHSFHFDSSLPGGGFELSDNEVKTVAHVLPGSYTVTEDDQTPAYDLTGLVCDDGPSATPSTTSKQQRTATVGVDPGETVRCVFTNSKRGKVVVVKTEGHGDPAAGRVWRFTLTGGPDGVDEERRTDGGTGPDQVAFDDLKAGSYTLCEVDMPDGWHSSLEQAPGAVVDPDTGDVCIELTIANGETETIAVDNVRPDVELDKTVRRLPDGDFAKTATAHVGETVEYRFRVTNAGVGALSVVLAELAPDRCDAGTLTQPAGDPDGDGKLDPGEQWDYRCTHVVTGADPDPLPNTAKATGTDEYGNADSAESSASVNIVKPGTAIVKEGNQFAYPGDTVSFTFAVTNGGDSPLSDVAVTDDRCAPVTGPAQKLDGDQDELLEPGEKWIFTCSKQIPAGHKIGDENPIRNVATVTATDELGKTVTDDDDHLVRVLHPAIDIEKTGPATATAGTPLGYTLTVTNPGDVPFAAQEVGVTDPRCEQPPAGPSTGADATPGQLDPGDTWTYTCTAQTTGQPAGTFVNTATVTARDFNGRTVTDTDDFPTMLEVQQVLPQPRIVNGTARLSGPSGCARKPFKATVRGSRIAHVTFFRDGKRIKRIVAKPGQRTFTVRLEPGDAQGVHRVTARVRFKAASHTRTRTLRLSYQRCRRQVVTPRFTG
jgi:hypothetical protein